MGFLDGIFGGGGSDVPAPIDPLKVAKSGPNKGTSLATRHATSLFGNYYPSVFPQVLGLQEQYAPQFLEQAFGAGGQAYGGFAALRDTAAAREAEAMGGLRAQELGTMTGQTGLTRGLMAALSPEQAAAVQASAQEAERARVSAQGVTPEEQRMYQQTAREAAQASGRLGGNAAIASEIMGREDVLARKRAEAAQARQQSYGLASGFYTAPGLELLSRTPASYGAGTQMAGMGVEYGQSLGPQIDYNMPLGLAQQRAGALDAYNMAKYQADQQRRAGIMNLLGTATSLGSAVMTGGASMGLGSLMTSMGGGMGSTGLFNAGANLFNMGAGAGTPLKATIV